MAVKLKSDERDLLKDRYTHYREKNDAPMAVRMTVSWYTGWHRIVAGREISEEQRREIEGFLSTIEPKKMIKCPNCGKEATTPLKEWDLGLRVHIRMYKCEKCGKTFREAIRRA